MTLVMRQSCFRCSVMLTTRHSFRRGSIGHCVRECRGHAAGVRRCALARLVAQIRALTSGRNATTHGGTWLPIPRPDCARSPASTASKAIAQERGHRGVLGSPAHRSAYARCSPCNSEVRPPQCRGCSLRSPPPALFAPTPGQGSGDGVEGRVPVGEACHRRRHRRVAARRQGRQSVHPAAFRSCCRSRCGTS